MTVWQIFQGGWPHTGAKIDEGLHNQQPDCYCGPRRLIGREGIFLEHRHPGERWAEPQVCDQCGAVDTMPDPCRCWISLDSMPLADVKAIFATGDMSVERWTE